ncbi:hypothetical protein [Pseudomonas gingeri]|uniref:Uncharacterized protein n=1 Tax=Pseudomonas gingeri TaxID=117681 RepID=A0A7Y7WUD7_9PSED|nr:hypothetical protein [Pseudomonas gingeri]NWB87894.1 hypothetical protein [Pseudomonas gingeri]
MNAKTHQKMMTEAQASHVRELSAVQRMDARLEVLQVPEAAQCLQSLLAAKGKLIRRPEAGASF